jgi:hypothetical protein
MRQFAAVALLLSVAACASSTTGTPNLRQQCEDRFETVWVAAQSALVQLDARVVNANQAAGSIMGRIDADVYGAEIEIGVNVRRSPDIQRATQEPLWVEVRTWDPSTNDPDPRRLADLKFVAEEVLNLIRSRAQCGPPM